PVGDVAGGVPRRLQHAHLMRTEGESVSLAHSLVEAGNLGRLAARTDDRALRVGLQGQVAGGVVTMMVSRQNMRELPTLRLERGGHGLRLRRVDGGDNAPLG